MSVSGIGSYDQLQSIYAALGIDSTQSTSSTTSSYSLGYSSDQASISQGAQLMSYLSKLQSSSPETFKSVTKQISEDLAEQAENCSDTQQSKFLSEMSEKFASASESGQMSDLRPQAPASGNLAMASNAAPPPPPPDFSGSSSISSNAAPPPPPPPPGMGSNAGSAIRAYGLSSSNPMSLLDSIISKNLSSLSSSTTTSSSLSLSSSLSGTLSGSLSESGSSLNLSQLLGSLFGLS